MARQTTGSKNDAASKDSSFPMNRFPLDRRASILGLLVEGTSLRTTTMHYNFATIHKTLRIIPGDSDRYESGVADRWNPDDEPDFSRFQRRTEKRLSSWFGGGDDSPVSWCPHRRTNQKERHTPTASHADGVRCRGPQPTVFGVLPECSVEAVESGRARWAHRHSR